MIYVRRRSQLPYSVFQVMLDPISSSGLINNITKLKENRSDLGFAILNAEYNIMIRRPASWGLPDMIPLRPRGTLSNTSCSSPASCIRSALNGFEALFKTLRSL